MFLGRFARRCPRAGALKRERRAPPVDHHVFYNAFCYYLRCFDNAFDTISPFPKDAELLQNTWFFAVPLSPNGANIL